MTRDDKKKLLIVQGMVHRLEIAHGLDQLKSQMRPAAFLGKLPSVIKLIMASNAVPLLSTLVPLVLGKNKVARLVRRVVLILGGGAALMAIMQRWKSARSKTTLYACNVVASSTTHKKPDRFAATGTFVYK